MSLYENLQRAQTEEDVKDCYIKALKLKAYSKNLVDIQTEQVWFEAPKSRTGWLYNQPVPYFLRVAAR